MTQQPLTAWQKLRVQAAAGLPIAVEAEMQRAIARAGEQLDAMVSMNVELLKRRDDLKSDLRDALKRNLEIIEQRQPILASADRLIASSAHLRRALLIWQMITVMLGVGWLADMAGLIPSPQDAARSAMLAARKKPKAKMADIIRAGTDAANEAMGYRSRLEAWKIANEVWEGMKP